MRYLHDISCFLAIVRFPYEISCLLALAPTRLFRNSRGFGVDGEEVMQRHEWEGEFGSRGGGGCWGICWENSCAWAVGCAWRIVGCTWREKSWLCMKFKLAFFGGHCILIRFLPPCYLALTVNELCLLFLPTLCDFKLCAAHIFRMGFPCIIVRLPYEMSCFLSLKRFHEISNEIPLWNFHVRFHVFAALFSYEVFFMRFHAYLLHNFLERLSMSFHIILP